MTIAPSRLFLIYSAVAVTLAAGATVTQAVSAPKVQVFDTIEVKRINLREPDGTLRLVVSNRAAFPGVIFKGKERPHKGRTDSAGMLFFDDEGTEDGGLIYGGSRGPDGKVRGFGHLSFDQYMQDQVVNFEQGEEDGHRKAGLAINDMPDAPMDLDAIDRLEKMPDGPEKNAAIQAMVDAGVGGKHRLFMGKAEGVSMLSFKDAAGKERLRMTVSPEGAAAIDFIDADGKVARTVTPTAG
jgi:hypothetical protein